MLARLQVGIGTHAYCLFQHSRPTMSLGFEENREGRSVVRRIGNSSVGYIRISGKMCESQISV